MALAGQNQVRQMYVGLDYPGHATVAAVKAGTQGDLAVLSSDGTAVAAGEKFQFNKLNNKGVLVTSDVIDPSKILYSKSQAYVAPVLGTATISGITANANTLYTVEIIISEFGSYSPENEYVKKGFYKSKVGDNAENIVDGLVASLARNFKREEPTTGATFAYTAASGVVNLPDNVYFTFAKAGAGAAAQLVITEKAGATDNFFDADRRTRHNVKFLVNASFTTVPTIANTPSNAGVGTGKQVMEMEHYLRGERGDYMRGMGYPHNFADIQLDSVITGQYNFVEIGYYEEGRDEAKKSKKQITIAMEDGQKAAMNTMIGDLNTVLGAGSIPAIP